MGLTYKSFTKTLIAERRARVAALRLRRLSLVDIAKELEKEGYINPNTDAAWSPSVIHNDVRAVQKAWEKESTELFDKLRAEQFAEIREARKTAWAAQDISQIRQLIQLEMSLMGTTAPTNSLVNNGEPLQVVIKYENYDPSTPDTA